jgi:DNA-binding NarL/FixJ family response regulator
MLVRRYFFVALQVTLQSNIFVPSPNDDSIQIKMTSSMHGTIKLFIVDDHAVIRFAMEAWSAQASQVNGASEIQVIGSAENGADALRLIPEAKPNFLLIDLQLPDMEGTDVIQQLRTGGWSSDVLCILLMTGLETAPIKEILASGANSYISKQESSEAFMNAIRNLFRDPSQMWLNPAVAKQMLSSERAINEAGITAAEKNVLRLIRLSNEEIGEILDISKGTVKNHVANIFQKLGITEREEAVQFAIKVGLIPRSSRL